MKWLVKYVDPFSKDSHAFRIPEFPRLPDAVFSLPAVSGSSLWTSYPSSGKFLKRMIPPRQKNGWERISL